MLRPDDAGFWATHQGAEIDLILQLSGQRFGVEVKRSDAPRMTRSVHKALAELRLNAVAIIYPGTKHYALEERANVVPIAKLATTTDAAELASLLGPTPSPRPRRGAGERRRALQARSRTLRVLPPAEET